MVSYKALNTEFEIHSILAAKGLRYNDQREFFTIDTTDAINTLLSLKDEKISMPIVNSIKEDKSFNKDIDLVNFLHSLEQKIQDYKESDFYKSAAKFYDTKLFLNSSKSEEDLNVFESFIDNGFYSHIVPSSSKYYYDIELQIQYILGYTDKGYISGYIDVIELYLDSIDGVDNVPSDKKIWIANMLDQFAKNFRNVSERDIYIDRKIPLYCGISYALGLQYDKKFLEIIDFDIEEWTFQELFLWGLYSDLEERGNQLLNSLRAEQDALLGTNNLERNKILNSERYKFFHSAEGEVLCHQGYSYAHGMNGYEKDTYKAEDLFEKAVNNNYKVAYLGLLFINYKNTDKFFEIVNKGALDSCPQCLMEAAVKILNDCDENLNKGIKKKINRYMDLFISQIDTAFYVDEYYCLESIKGYLFLSVAFKRGINKSIIKEILNKIRIISDIEIEDFYSNMSVECYYPFDDYELIVYEATLIMKELLGI